MRNSKKLKIGILILVLALIVTGVTAVAYFTDRANDQVRISVATFTKDGYTITREYKDMLYIANEDIDVKITEGNEKNDVVYSNVTMSVKWVSPDTTCSPFGNETASDNATISIGGKTIDYTVNSDGTITFTLPEHEIPAESEKERTLKFHIPDSLKSTGYLEFTFDGVKLTNTSGGGFTAEFSREDINAKEKLDFDARVVWDLSENLGDKKVIGYLDPDYTGGEGEYGVIVEGAGTMYDWADENSSRQSEYKDSTKQLTIKDGVTDIGSHAFHDFTGVTSVDLPDSLVSIGESAFDSSGLTGEVVIPGSVTVIESLAFGNLPNVNVFTFEHTSNTLTLPDNISSGKTNKGAFYVSDYVETTINTTVEEIFYGYRWHNDNRRLIPTLSEHETWQYTVYDSENDVYETYIDYSLVEEINIVDYVWPPNGVPATSWEASDSSVPGTVTAYLSDDGKTLTIAGNGYGSIFANEDSNWAFSSYENVGFDNMKRINGAEILDTSNVVDASAMFTDNDSLEYVNVSNWNTSKMKYTNWGYYGMFGYCPKLQNIDVATKTITREDGTTYTAWDLSQAESLCRMFFGDESITAVDVSGWNTSSCTDMSQMFTDTAISKIAVDNWDTSKVVDMYGMFDGCENLETINVSKWDVGQATNMRQMFAGSGLKSIDLSNWDESVVVNAYYMFGGCESLESVNLVGWNLSNIEADSPSHSTCDMFFNCSSLKELTIPASLTILADSFAQNCTSLTKIEFLHDADTEIYFPAAGSAEGAFYVDEYLETQIIATNQIALDYNWGRDNRAKYNITYVVNGGTLPEDAVTSFVPSVPPVLPVPTKEGYAFDGWYESESLSGSPVTSLSGEYEDKTLYAKWRIPQVTLLYMDNVTPDEIIETNTSADLPTPTRDGYAFGGWYLANEEITSSEIDSFTDPNGTYPWSQDEDGIWSSGNAGVKSSTSDMLSETFTLNEYGYISFDWRSNGENNYDYLGFDILNVETGEYLSGETTPTYKKCLQTLKGAASTEFTTVEYDLPAGTYQILFMYGKDSSGDQNEDKGFVKNIQANNRVYSPSETPVPETFSGDIIVAAKWDVALVSISVTTPPDKTGYLDGDTFDQTGMVVMATYSDGSTKVITNYTVIDGTNMPVGQDKITVSYTEDGVTKTATTPVSVAPILTKIEVTTPPDTTKYLTGSDFDKTGMVVTATYSDGSTKVITNYTVTDGTNMPVGQDKITVSYTENGITKTATTPISVVDPIYQAIYSADDESLTFIYDFPFASGDTYNGKAVTAVYTGFETTSYSSSSSRPWYQYRASIKSVVFEDVIQPISTAYWFYGFSSCTSMDLANLDTSNVTDMRDMFYKCSSLTSLDVSNFNTSSVTDMTGMFAGCSSLTSLDVSNFNTSSVTDMTGMFNSVDVLVDMSLTSLDLSNFDTSKVTSMGAMFQGCSSLTALDISNFDTSKVTSMEAMFSSCSSLTSLDVSNFNTSSVTDMGQMFAYCSSLTSLDVTNFDTSKVTDMGQMFLNCSSLTSLDVSSFNTSNVTDMHDMFRDCYNLTTIYASQLWSTDSVTTSTYMFHNSGKLVGGNGTKHDRSYVTATRAVLDGIDGKGYLTYKPLPIIVNVITPTGSSDAEPKVSESSVYTVSGTVVDNSGTGVKSVTVNGVNVTVNGDGTWSTDITLTKDVATEIKVVAVNNAGNTMTVTRYVGWYDVIAQAVYSASDKSLTFVRTRALSVGDTYNSKTVTAVYTGFETTSYSSSSNRPWYQYRNSIKSVVFEDEIQPISTAYWFDNFYNCASMNLTKLNTSKVTSMSYMFQECKALASLDVTNFDTSKVTGMSYMFRGCATLTSLDLSSFDTSNVKYMAYMFSVGSIVKSMALETIYVSDLWSTENVTSSSNMFNSCTNLVGGSGTVYDSTNIDASYAKIDGGTADPGYFTASSTASNLFSLVRTSDGSELEESSSGVTEPNETNTTEETGNSVVTNEPAAAAGTELPAEDETTETLDEAVQNEDGPGSGDGSDNTEVPSSVEENTSDESGLNAES